MVRRSALGYSCFLLRTVNSFTAKPFYKAFDQKIDVSRMSSSATSNDIQVIPGRPTWQQTMLRIRDPTESLKFYTEHLGFTLIDTLDFPQWRFSLYFLTTLPEGEAYTLRPGTQEAHDYLWNMEGVALELTHNHGTEKDCSSPYHAGNKERDGKLCETFGGRGARCYSCILIPPLLNPTIDINVLSLNICRLWTYCCLRPGCSQEMCSIGGCWLPVPKET